MRRLSALSALILALLLTGCLKDKITETYTYTIYAPVYKLKSEVYANIKSNSPQAIKSPGKIFLFGNYIFLNEVNKGVHIIDNTDPAHPVARSFIDMPGNLDMVVKGNTLYADLYTDLVVVDISDPLQASFVKYIPNVFPERNFGNGYSPDPNRIIVDWIRKDTTITIRIENNRWRGGVLYSTMAGGDIRVAGGSSNITAPGIAGSMARMVIVSNHLYSVNSSDLGVFELNNPHDPQQLNTTHIGWNIETIYPFQNKLFIGSMNGMFIYDISNPSSPVQQGQFMHARACDPVISDGNYAYITLHDGTPCQGYNNQLDVVNVSNLQSPSLLKTYLMTNPQGLAKDNNILFVCDGRDGLRIYNASNPSNMDLVRHITGLETYDAIAWNKNLVVVAKDGLYQYDYTDVNNPRLLSKISITQ